MVTINTTAETIPLVKSVSDTFDPMDSAENNARDLKAMAHRKVIGRRIAEVVLCIGVGDDDGENRLAAPASVRRLIELVTPALSLVNSPVGECDCDGINHTDTAITARFTTSLALGRITACLNEVDAPSVPPKLFTCIDPATIE